MREGDREGDWYIRRVGRRERGSEEREGVRRGREGGEGGREERERERKVREEKGRDVTEYIL